MRAYKGLGKEGFTLVELVIVVATLGVLVVLAIYGVRRYLASANTSEAKNTLGAIVRGATASFMRDGVFCASANPVPATTAALHDPKYQPDFDSGDSRSGWKCLGFVPMPPTYVQYNYNAGGGYLGPPLGGPDPGPNGFEAAAQGDIDGDGSTFSVITRGGTVDTATKQLRLQTQVFIANEFE